MEKAKFPEISDHLKNLLNEINSAELQFDLGVLAQERFGSRAFENFFFPGTYSDPIDESKWEQLLRDILDNRLRTTIKMIPVPEEFLNSGNNENGV